MPLELGADLALRLAGSPVQRARKTLVLDKEKHRYSKMLSDIAGMDIEAHDNSPQGAIKRVRDWLNVHRGADPILPGGGDRGRLCRLPPYRSRHHQRVAPRPAR
jgi:hypothetical protein